METTLDTAAPATEAPPAADAPVAAAAPARAAAATQPCDVFIVDDTGGSRELLASIIRNFAGRLEIREARNGQEALAIWPDLRPRITLLDIDMPGLDGISVLKKIREMAPQAFVAMISGVGSVDHVREALTGGAGGFVIKPYKPQRILDLLERYEKLSGQPLLKDRA